MKKQSLRVSAKSACRMFQDDDNTRQLWSLTLPVKELPRGLPYGPNARNAKLNVKPVQAMQETLNVEPQEFIYYNNGIMLVVESLQARRIDGGDFDVQISYLESTDSDDEQDRFSGHGVLNGGHTYMALMNALEQADRSSDSYPHIDRAYVQVTVAVGIKEDDVPRISRARNLSRPVPEYSLKNLEGQWDKVIACLPQKYHKNVVFKEGDPDKFPAYTVVDLVQRLALLNNELFPWRSDRSKGVKELHPVSVYTGKGSLVSRWNNGKNYGQVLPLLPDILWLEEKVMEAHEQCNGKGGDKIVVSRMSGNAAKPCTLITGKTFGVTVAAPYVMPVMAAFRVFIQDGRWIRAKEDLWEEYGFMLVKKLWEEYKLEGRSSAATFGRSKSTWATLVNEVVKDFIRVQ